MQTDIQNEVRRVLAEEAEALNTIALHSAHAIAHAAELLARSEFIAVSGVGKSGLVGAKIAATLSSTGSKAVVLHPTDALHGDIGLVDHRFAALLLSHSGASSELLQLVPALRRRGVPVVAITNNSESPLGKLSDVAIPTLVRREACPLRLAPTTSTTAALAVGDALAAGIMILKGITAADFASSHPMGQLGRNLTVTVNEVMHSGDNLPVVRPQQPFREALIESTKKSLGCVCVVNSDGVFSGIITDGDVRRILERHEDIRDLLTGSVMTQNPIAVRSGALLGEALSLMEKREKPIGVLPVVSDSGKLQGVVRIHDIIRAG